MTDPYALGHGTTKNRSKVRVREGGGGTGPYVEHGEVVASSKEPGVQRKV